MLCRLLWLLFMLFVLWDIEWFVYVRCLIWFICIHACLYVLIALLLWLCQLLVFISWLSAIGCLYKFPNVSRWTWNVLECSRNFLDNILELSKKWLEMHRKLIEMSEHFLDVSSHFLDISRNLLDISRHFLDMSRTFLDMYRKS